MWRIRGENESRVDAVPPRSDFPLERVDAAAL